MEHEYTPTPEEILEAEVKKLQKREEDKKNAALVHAESTEVKNVQQGTYENTLPVTTISEVKENTEKTVYETMSAKEIWNKIGSGEITDPKAVPVMLEKEKAAEAHYWNEKLSLSNTPEHTEHIKQMMDISDLKYNNYLEGGAKAQAIYFSEIANDISHIVARDEQSDVAQEYGLQKLKDLGLATQYTYSQATNFYAMSRRLEGLSPADQQLAAPAKPMESTPASMPAPAVPAPTVSSAPAPAGK